MRPAVILTLAATALGACSGTRADIAAETAAVQARSQALAAAEAARDIEAALTFWAPDAIAHAAGAPQIRGHEAIRAQYDSLFDAARLKQFQGTASHLEVSRAGDLAWEYGVNRFLLAGPAGDLRDIGKYLAVWRKIDGQWYVTALSFTSDFLAPLPAGSD